MRRSLKGELTPAYLPFWNVSLRYDTKTMHELSSHVLGELADVVLGALEAKLLNSACSHHSLGILHDRGRVEYGLILVPGR